MQFYQGKIEFYFSATRIQGIIMNLSHDIEHFGMLLDALELRLIKGIGVRDKNSNLSITIQLQEEAKYVSDTYELQMSLDQIILLKKMICDVVIGNSFPGYHIDFEIPSENGFIDLCMTVS